MELGWVGGSEDGSEDISAGWPGEEELGTWLGHRVAMPVLFIEQCGWVGFVGWEKKNQKRSSFQARLE